MNINQQEALVFVLLGMSLMFFGRLSVYAAIALYHKFKLELEYMNHPRLVPYNEYQACRHRDEQVHDWHSAQLVLRGLPVGMYKVCLTCGSIMGNNEFMVSNEVLDKMAEAIKIGQQKKELERQVQERIEGLRRSYVDGYITRNFKTEINDVHLAERLRALGDYSVTALADASEKVAAELTGQEELEEKYGEWPKALGRKSNSGGNA